MAMNSGIRCGFGSWIVAIAAALSGCDDAISQGVPGAAGMADSAGSAGSAGSVTNAGAAGTAGAARSGSAPSEGVELIQSGARVTNTELGIQGFVFAYADPHSAVGMTTNLSPPVDSALGKACIKGTAAKVDMFSDTCVNMTFTPPATDCFGEYSGAGIAMTLNQPLDPAASITTPAPPFDASALEGFAFEISGPTVPAKASLEFRVETSTDFNPASDADVFCNLPTVKLVPGANYVLFSELVDRCFRISDDPPNPSAETVQSKLTRIVWRVRTNNSASVPFDFCISNVRALLK